VPSKVPPQLTLYHLRTPPEPNTPPTEVSVTLCPLQIVVADALIATGAVDGLVIVTAAEAQVVLPQGPSALT
jgi:hypothetical protein